MDLLRLISAAIIVLFFKNVFSYNTVWKNQERCNNFSVEPNFDTEIVVGAPWYIYHTWHMTIDKTCLSMTFKNATPMVVHRIWTDMNEYLENQPYWDAATLVMCMGNMFREVLLLATQGPSGSFVGVPNVVRYGNITPLKKSVQLLMFQMKLVEDDTFLIMLDCDSGVGTMSARAQVPNRTLIGAVARSLNLGDNFPACVKDKPKEGFVD